MIRRIVLTAALSVASFAWAQDAGTAAPAAPAGPVEPPPSAEQVKKFLDYQDNGKDRGPVLLDLIPCTKVDQTQGSPTRYQCIEPVTGPVAKGTTVFAWLQWLVPKDGNYPDIQIQILQGTTVRKTIDNPVTGVGRTRGWRGDNFNGVGTWTLKVIRGDKELGSAKVEVVAK